MGEVRRGGRFSDADVARMRAEWQEVLAKVAAHYRLPFQEVASWCGAELLMALRECGQPTQTELARRWGTTHPYWHDLVFLGREGIRARHRAWRRRRRERLETTATEDER